MPCLSKKCSVESQTPAIFSVALASTINVLIGTYRVELDIISTRYKLKDISLHLAIPAQILSSVFHGEKKRHQLMNTLSFHTMLTKEV